MNLVSIVGRNINVSCRNSIKIFSRSARPLHSGYRGHLPWR